MSTVSTSLRMFDQMTRPLQQVTQALNLTISAMDNMNKSANRDIRITNSLNSAREAIQRAGSGLQELVKEQDRARSSQDRLNNSFNNGIDSAGGLTGKVKGLVGAYLGFQTIKKGLDSTIGGAANLERQLITISGMLGNKDVGKAYFEKINDYALISQYGLKDFAAISRQFIQFTKNTDKLMDLNKLSERLAFLDPSQGLEGAGFALKEILGGDGMSLKSRFGFGSDEIKQLKEASNIDDFMEKFNHMLNEKGGTQLAVEEAAGAAISLWDNLIANIQTSFSKAGNNALEAIKPLLKTLNEGFKEGKFQPFFDGLANGIVTVVNAGLRLSNIIQSIGSSIQNNWGIISPILAAAIGAIVTLKGAMIAYNIVQGISKGIQLASAIATAIHGKTTLAKANADAAATASQWGLNAAILACPITWIVGGILLLIAVFYAAIGAVNKFAGTSLSATGMIVGSIAVAGTIIWNIIIGVINAIIQAVWSIFAEPFIGIIEWVLNAANGGFNSFGGAVANLIGEIISWFLSLGKVVTKIIDAIFGTDWTSGLSSLQDNVLKWGGNDKAITLDRTMPTIDKRINYSDAYDSGYNFGKNLGDKFSFKMPNTPDVSSLMGDQNALLNDWNMDQKDGFGTTNDNLGKIKDSIDVSNENLELMRDLAEQESIQNFVTLTPTVQVTTGDIKEEADINKIISKIENYMENELANSAEGVYA
ncbi:hypothetical protein KQI86_19375 [Clostridium sp. MSJ-11]|uniref:Uncharacterized protein n=1 Tax=Clostridium mobile TaxID=2841512 RepID=A0ABS6EMK8_9CLOT|nr:hypothetical protein [Clostridium mobile]MBU5486466.1 hypothetical protein [Clostridium mobile]